MSRLTPEREAWLRAMYSNGAHFSNQEVGELLAEIDALRAEYTAPGGTTMGECPVHAIRWLGHAPCPTCKTENDALAARVRELETVMVKCALPYEALLMDGGSRKWIAPSVWKLIEEAVAEMRAALGPTRRDAP